MFRIGFWIVISFFLPMSALQASPELFAFSVEGSVTTPILEPQVVSLLLNHEYVFMIDNHHDESVVLNFGGFGQTVSTIFLQGNSHMTQESMVLLPHAKIMWHFYTTAEGEFPLGISNPAMKIPAASGKIRIAALEDPAKADPAKKDTSEAAVDVKNAEEPTKKGSVARKLFSER